MNGTNGYQVIGRNVKKSLNFANMDLPICIYLYTYAGLGQTTP